MRLLLQQVIIILIPIGLLSSLLIEPFSIGENDVELNTTTTRRNLTKNEDDRRDYCDFEGKTLSIVVSPQPPLVDCLQDDSAEWICNGSNIEVIKVLEKKLNFKANWLVISGNNHYEPPTTSSDGRKAKPQTPSEKSTRNHSGVLGLIENGRAWLSANGFMSIIDRNNEALKLSEPFDAFKVHFLLSKSVQDHDHIFLKPFNTQAWLAILGSALVVVPIFYLVNTTSCYYHLRDIKFLHSISLLDCIKFKLIKLGNKIKMKHRNILVRSTESTLTLSEDKLFNELENNTLPGITNNPATISGGSFYRSRQELAFKRVEQQIRRHLMRRKLALAKKQALKLGKIKHSSGFFRLAYILWYVVGSLAAQGGETEDLPEADSTRILIAFWWLYLIVICSIHSGILTAILTFPKQNDFIQNLDDFLALEHNDGVGMKLTVDRQSEIANLLSDSNNLHKSPLQMIVNHPELRIPIVQVDFGRHRQRILDEIQLGQAAYLEEKSAIDLIITQEYFDQGPPLKCQFKSSKFPIDIIPMSFALSKRKFTQNCLKRINGILKKILQSGLSEKWRRRFEAQGNDCLETVIINAGDVDKIELKHVKFGFWLLIVGLSIGSLSLAAEILWFFTSELAQEEECSSQKNKPEAGRVRFSSARGADHNDSQSSSQGDEDDEDSALGTTSTSNEEKTEGGTESSSSSSSDEIRLGHRMNLLAQRSLRSLKLNRKSKIKQLRDEVMAGPEVSEVDDVVPSSAGSRLAPVQLEQQQQHQHQHQQRRRHHEDPGEARKRRRLARAAERRAERFKRTMGLVKRLHEGRLYTELLIPKISNRIQTRARRASHAIVSHFQHKQQQQHPPTDAIVVVAPPAQVVRRRRHHENKKNVTSGRINLARVVPK